MRMFRRWRIRRPSLWFAAAGLLAVAAAVGTMRTAAAGDRVAIVVAAGDLAVGAALDNSQNVRVIHVAAGARLPGMLADPSEIAGRVPAAPIGAGEPITDAALGGRRDTVPRPLAVGERAMSLPASSAGATLPVLVPGALVDVIASQAEAGGAEVIVRGAEVISVQMPADSAAAEAGAILLRLREPEALRLGSALDRVGVVRLLPRPYRESATP